MSNGFLSEQNAEQPIAPVEVVPTKTVEINEPVEEVSSVEADEQSFEQLAETAQEEDFLHEEVEAPVTPVQGEAASATAPVAAAAIVKDDVMKEVEKILEDGLANYFHALPPNAQERFQKKGEEVAVQIAVMVRGFKVEVKRVLQLIRDWLLTVPGVNKFFLEQEAKIKTDRILVLEHAIHEPTQPS